jgi:peptidoglycan hydrolase CwlO-like protein
MVSGRYKYKKVMINTYLINTLQSWLQTGLFYIGIVAGLHPYSNETVEALRVQLKKDIQNINILRAQSTALQTQLDESKQTITALQTQLDESNQTITASNQKITALQSQLGKSNQTITALQTQLDGSNQKITALQTQLDKSNQTITESNQTITALQTQLDGSNQKITALQAQLDKSNQTITESNQTITALQTQLDGSNQKITASNQKITALETQLDQSNQKITALETQLDQSNQTITALQTRLDEKDQQTKSITILTAADKPVVDRTVIGALSNIFDANIIGMYKVSNTKRLTWIHIIDKSIPDLVLRGSDTVTVELGQPYKDLGVHPNELTVTKDGATDSNSVGVYRIEYTGTNSIGAQTRVTRNVTVTDRISPLITMYGNARSTHQAGTPYIDSGVIATDASSNGHITIVSTGKVEVNTVGFYKLTYTATDDSFNSASRDRIVEVVGPKITILNNIKRIEHCITEIYIDAGATAIDASGDVDVVTTVPDMSIPGDLEVKYTATDAYGNISIATRIVTAQRYLFWVDYEVTLADEMTYLFHIQYDKRRKITWNHPTRLWDQGYTVTHMVFDFDLVASGLVKTNDGLEAIRDKLTAKKSVQTLKYRGDAPDSNFWNNGLYSYDLYVGFHHTEWIMSIAVKGASCVWNGKKADSITITDPATTPDLKGMVEVKVNHGGVQLHHKPII